MARFALRKQEKIKSTFGDERLKSLIEVLGAYFTRPDEKLKITDGKPYPTLDVGIATVYVTRKFYDVYHLALKYFNNKT
uniref:Uncharacterized protein n=1 Tax=Myoviridae sp. ctiX384 TaxID=2827702 RepID=A0A8S5TB70_9CAUD|nr:MAG TPA: hypothetical protein [Myoviridae sp. ctiX384]